MAAATKAVLAEGLKLIMQEKPLSRITISELVERVGFSRHTFYYHFQDIYSLALWSLKSEWKTSIYDRWDGSSWEKGFNSLCCFLMDNREFVIAMYRSDCRERLKSHLRQRIQEMIMTAISYHNGRYRVSDRQKSLVCDFYSHAFSGVLFDWIDNNMSDDYHFISETLMTIIQGEISDALVRLNA